MYPETFDSLDYMMPGRVLNVLHRETGDERYEIAARTIRARLDDYPRTSDGGLWHAVSYHHQLWADGAFMVAPFLAEFGARVRRRRVHRRGVRQAARRLRQPPAAGQRPAAPRLRRVPPDGVGRPGHRPRAGDVVPRGRVVRPRHDRRARGPARGPRAPARAPAHPRRPGRRLRGVPGPRVPACGSRSSTRATWRTTGPRRRARRCTRSRCPAPSSGAGSTPTTRTWPDRGYAGVLGRISIGEDGLTRLTDIVVGTNVGDYRYYVDRTRGGQRLPRPRRVPPHERADAPRRRRVRLRRTPARATASVASAIPQSVDPTSGSSKAACRLVCAYKQVTGPGELDQAGAAAARAR
jgi:unsaturated rhamnogalacturonyl hydrolase